jgi:hypothetical protein
MICPSTIIGLIRTPQSSTATNCNTSQTPVSGSISTFAKLDAEKRAKLNLFDGDADKLSQLEKVIKALPIVECKAEAFTEGETSITMSDAITLKFTVTYPNYAPNEAPGYVHSTNFPFLKRQKWYLIVSDGATKE